MFYNGSNKNRGLTATLKQIDMKKLSYVFYFVLALVLCGGCGDNVNKNIYKHYVIIEIDSCEYILYPKHKNADYGHIAHKGNCKYCAKRALAN